MPPQVIGEANFKVDSKMKVSLANPNIAVATDPKTGKHHKGTWTNVYDEGFEVPRCPVRVGRRAYVMLFTGAFISMAALAHALVSGAREQQEVLRLQPLQEWRFAVPQDVPWMAPRRKEP